MYQVGARRYALVFDVFNISNCKCEFVLLLSSQCSCFPQAFTHFTMYELVQLTTLLDARLGTSCISSGSSMKEKFIKN